VRLADYLTTWSTLHGGLPATGLIRWWLCVQFVLARPLARLGVAPSVITLAGIAPAAALIGVAAVTGPAGTGSAELAARWGWCACVLVAASAVLDGLDGAVAVLTDRVSTRGARLDAVTDRGVEAAWALSLILLGTPVWAMGPALVLTYGLEFLRPRWTPAGAPPALTIWERPTRVLVTMLFPLAGSVLAQPGWLAATGPVWLALAVIAGIQLVSARRRGPRGRAD